MSCLLIVQVFCVVLCFCGLFVENTEGAIKNGYSRETDYIGYTRHQTKTNKTKNTPLYVNKHK
jgi:hypothetical protein